MLTPTVHSRFELRAAELHPSVDDPALHSMTFLNEVSHRYPDAISLAAGRPAEAFFELDSVHRYLDVFCQHLRDDVGYSEEEVRRTIFQYGRTKGVLHHLIARNLAVDENIDADPESIVVTVGCQEALYLCLRALRSDDQDVVLAVSPTYVGLAGAARLADMRVLPVRDAGGIDFDDLFAVLRHARGRGLRPRALYLIPDFANPSGISMTVEDKRRLLDVAAQQDFLVLEDNPYGLFSDSDDRPPTLKALDTRNQVVYLGTLAKSALPGVRVGYAVADQEVVTAHGTRTLFADELAKIKSMLTVNTSPIAQAVAGGRLLEHGCSLVRANVRETEHYRVNRRRLLNGLADRFRPGDPGAAGVSWNSPTGGFFVVVTVPFAADDALLERSARVHGVLWTPMHHFYLGEGGLNQLRLSCAALTPEQIDLGLDRLHALVTESLTASWKGAKRQC